MKNSWRRYKHSFTSDKGSPGKRKGNNHRTNNNALMNMGCEVIVMNAYGNGLCYDPYGCDAPNKVDKVWFPLKNVFSEFSSSDLGQKAPGAGHKSLFRMKARTADFQKAGGVDQLGNMTVLDD
jgi:hypothetical protein